MLYWRCYHKYWKIKRGDLIESIEYKESILVVMKPLSVNKYGMVRATLIYVCCNSNSVSATEEILASKISRSPAISDLLSLG